MKQPLSVQVWVRAYTTKAVFVLCIVFFLSFALRYLQEQAIAETFFSSVLQMVGSQETVVVRGVELRVTDGKVSAIDGTAVSRGAAQKALRLAYARTLARRNPILGIPGVDPRFLSESARQLSEITDSLAKRQTSAQDASTARSLYPIRFLQSLAVLEESRISFIESGSDTDELTYRAALRHALTAGRIDIANFQNALGVGITADEIRFQGFGGPISVQSMRDAAKGMEARFQELEKQAQKLSMCLEGNVESCYPNALILGRALTKRPDETPRVSGVARSRVDEVIDLYAETMPKRSSSIFTDATPIALTQSACVSELPLPHVVILAGASPWGIPPIWYVADLYFSQTEDSEAVVLQYLKKNHDIRYSRINPMMFYVCPDVGVDLAKAWAVRATAEFALRHPEVARTHRERLLIDGDMWYESDAYAYARAAIAEISTEDVAPTVLEELETITLLWNENGAGLDGILASIVRTESNRLDMYDRGVPFDVSAKTHLLTRSAFPTLFLLDKQSIDILHGQSGTAVRAGDFLSVLATYGDIRTTVPRARIIRDLRESLIFEGVAL